MCESSAFLLGKNNELTRVMENVVDVTPTNGKVYLTDLLGEEKRNKINRSQNNISSRLIIVSRY